MKRSLIDTTVTHLMMSLGQNKYTLANKCIGKLLSSHKIYPILI